MSTPDPICAAVEELVIAKALGDAHREHVATCATCKGLIEMTGHIEKELAEVPVQLGQVPQWIAAMHVGNARRRKRIIWAGAFATVAATVALVVFAVGHGQPTAHKAVASAPLPPPAPPTRAPAPPPPAPPPPELTTNKPDPGVPGRPAWTKGLDLFTSSCTTTEGALSCVGVSTYRETREKAKTEASEAAMEALMNVVGGRIKTKLFTEHILPAYDEPRRRLLSYYAKEAEVETVPVTGTVFRQLASARHRATLALVASAGAAAPAQATDWYWEEYPKENGPDPKGNGPDTEFLVYVRYDLAEDQVTKLVALYQGPDVDVGVVHATVTPPGKEPRIPAFPLLAFAFADFQGGTLSVLDLLAGKPLRKALR